MAKTERGETNTINLKNATWKRLHHLKIELNLMTLSETVDLLIDKFKEHYTIEKEEGEK